MESRSAVIILNINISEFWHQNYSVYDYFRLQMNYVLPRSMRVNIDHVDKIYMENETTV